MSADEYIHVEHLLYNGKLVDYIWMIPVVGLTTLFASIEVGFSTMVRAFQKPVYHAIYGLTYAVAGLIFAPFFIAVWGVKGAIVSQVIVGILVLGSTVVMYKRWLPHKELKH